MAISYPWTLWTLDQLLTPDGYDLQGGTGRPVHLKMAWTEHPPWIHPIARTRRGLTTMDEAYWCFIDSHWLDQKETGDTLRHTFIWKGLEQDKKYWFRFLGWFEDQLTKSHSPIFDKTYPGWLLNLLISEPWSWLGDQPPSFTELLNEPWSWKGVTPPDFVLLFEEPWG